MNKLLEHNITSQWFKAAEGAGNFIGIRFGRISEGSSNVEWIYVSHDECDGIGAFAKLLRQQGEKIEQLPENKNPCLAVIAPLWSWFWYARRDKKICYAQREDWEATTIASPDQAGDVDYYLCSEAETEAILARCRAIGVTVNNLLLYQLDLAVRPELKRQGLTTMWTIPVNLRGDIKHRDDEENHVSCVDAAISESDSEQDIQQQVAGRLARAEHRANYLLLKLGHLISHKVKLTYFQKNSTKVYGSIGSFSNLGVWDTGCELESRDSWLFCPPVMTGQLLGAGCVTFRNRLALTLQIHSGIENSEQKAKRCMQRWVEAITFS